MEVGWDHHLVITQVYTRQGGLHVADLLSRDHDDQALNWELLLIELSGDVGAGLVLPLLDEASKLILKLLVDLFFDEASMLNFTSYLLILSPLF